MLRIYNKEIQENKLSSFWKGRGKMLGMFNRIKWKEEKVNKVRSGFNYSLSFITENKDYFVSRGDRGW